MNSIFAERIQNVPESFIRKILKVSLDKSIVSFAGGIPNPNFFPVQELEEASKKVFAEQGASALQYSSSDGTQRLRETIAKRYQEKMGLDISPDSIIITSGSQQGLDMLGKILIDQDDRIFIEEPGYLGAIQALSLFRPEFVPIPLTHSGANTEILEEKIAEGAGKIFYCVPNFQNPSGLSYKKEVIEKISDIAKENKILIVEDSPYNELRFRGEPSPSFYSYLPEQTVLLGTFSKTVSPGFRLGWIVAPEEIREKLLIVKQATDLHTSNFTQQIIAQFIIDNDLDEHTAKISEFYGQNCRKMEQEFKENVSSDIEFTKPEGGMFLWGTLPEGMESMALFDFCIKEKVVFVPGEPFYTHNQPTRTFRLSFSCVDENSIKEGVSRFARAYQAYKESLQK